MKRGRLWLLLGVVLLLSALWGTALAADASTVTINGKNLQMDRYLYSDGTITADAPTDPSTGYALFHFQSNMSELLLYNMRIYATDGQPAVGSDGTLRIVSAAGTNNEIVATKGNGISIGGGGELTISGDGNLRVSANQPGGEGCAIVCTGFVFNELSGRLEIIAAGESAVGIKSADGANYIYSSNVRIAVTAQSGYAIGIFSASGAGNQGSDVNIVSTDPGSRMEISANSTGNVGYGIYGKNLNIGIERFELEVTGSTSALKLNSISLTPTQGVRPENILSFAGDAAPGSVAYPLPSAAQIENCKYVAIRSGETKIYTEAHYGGTAAANADNPFSIEIRPAAGYVIDTLYIDHQKATLTDAQRAGCDFSFLNDGGTHTLSVSFAYTVNFSQPAHGSLAVARAGDGLSSGAIVRGGEVLTISGTADSAARALALWVNGSALAVQNDRASYTVGRSGLRRALGRYEVPDQGADIAAVFFEKPVVEGNENREQSAYVNDTAVLAVTVTGDVVSYSWYVKPGGQNDFTAIPGANKPTYETQVLSMANDGDQYYCEMTDPGGNKVISGITTLQVSDPDAPGPDDPPKTGDAARPVLWLALALTGATGLVLRRGRRDRRTEGTAKTAGRRDHNR